MQQAYQFLPCHTLILRFPLLCCSPYTVSCAKVHHLSSAYYAFIVLKLCICQEYSKSASPGFPYKHISMLYSNLSIRYSLRAMPSSYAHFRSKFFTGYCTTGFSRTGLIPVDSHKILFKICEIFSYSGHLCSARASCEKKYHRSIIVFTP